MFKKHLINIWNKLYFFCTNCTSYKAITIIETDQLSIILTSRETFRG